MNNTHRVITEVTFKVVLDIDKDSIEAPYPSDEYNESIEALVEKWADETEPSFTDIKEAVSVDNYCQLQEIKIISK